MRAEHDAILIGAETLRRDNPSLGIKCEGREPIRVIVSRDGAISPELKIFHRGTSRVVIFSNIERPELSSLATVIVYKNIDTAFIITELEKIGVRSLFVEGGAQILDMFTRSSMVSRLRIACNPTIIVNDPSAPRFEVRESHYIDKREQNLGGMEVTTYIYKDSKSRDQRDHDLMQRAVTLSQQSPAKESCYRVGALIETLRGEIFEGYTLEDSPTHHAEQVALYKALRANADLAGATIYSSIEPCSQRSSEPESCSELIMRHGFARSLFALYEPSHFVECHGAENMRRAGIEVVQMPEFVDEVLGINAHLKL